MKNVAFQYAHTFRVRQSVDPFCPRYLSAPKMGYRASTWLLLDTLQHSIPSLGLRATQMGVAPTCFQTISSTQVHGFVIGIQFGVPSSRGLGRTLYGRFWVNAILRFSKSMLITHAVTESPTRGKSSNVIRRIPASLKSGTSSRAKAPAPYPISRNTPNGRRQITVPIKLLPIESSLRMRFQSTGSLEVVGIVPSASLVNPLSPVSHLRCIHPIKVAMIGLPSSIIHLLLLCRRLRVHRVGSLLSVTLVDVA
jgi:hypothetical protein